ncbi:MAG: sulfite exporter TauE/SafE family protein [Bacteroidota bacterium]
MLFYSAFQESYIWLPFIGLIVGVLATMIGSGGGLFFPLILILLFQVPAHIAVATSLAASLPLGIAGSIGHYRKKNIHFQLALLFGIAGIIGAVSGTLITRLLNSEQLKIAFGIYSILLAIIIFLNSRKQKKADTSSETSKKLNRIKISKGSVFGFAGGIISGTFGTSGAAPVLAGLIALHTPIKLVIGTSLFVVLVNTFSAFAGHFLVGEIDLTLVLFLTMGTIAGALIGPHLLSKINLEKYETGIKKIFVIIILISGIVLIFK